MSDECREAFECVIKKANPGFDIVVGKTAYGYDFYTSKYVENLYIGWKMCWETRSESLVSENDGEDAIRAEHWRTKYMGVRDKAKLVPVLLEALERATTGDHAIFDMPDAILKNAQKAIAAAREAMK